MPELVPIYERLVELAGGDQLAARFLSLYRPPGFVVGCSQAAWNRDGDSVLVRNYDYPASRAEGIIRSTAWTEGRVIGMSDCLWGLLDGVNEAGLAASLTFGGRRVVGDGFGIPLVVRYLLETCRTVADARGARATADPRRPERHPARPDGAPWSPPAWVPTASPSSGTSQPRPTIRTRTTGRSTPGPSAPRARAPRARTPAGAPDDSRAPGSGIPAPLYSTAFPSGFGTIYTAAYFPAEGRAEYLWPDFAWEQSFEEFAEGEHAPDYAGPRWARGHR